MALISFADTNTLITGNVAAVGSLLRLMLRR